ncbi:uncharacterized protein LOC135499881 [Lineus longissimus]|uniref:uncharacterized protein LOC135499881 n=1 Tax=Lineus longissimus TaxID=88925 RepID=UPI00315D8378
MARFLITCFEEKGTTMARRFFIGLFISLGFIGAAILIFLLHLRISPHPQFARYQRLPRCLDCETLQANNEPWLLSPADFDKKGIDDNFSRKMSKDEIKHYADLLRKFDELCEKADLTYFLCGGTLLGSYRHFGFIPWDDDVDVMVAHVDKNKTLKALSVPGYECVTDHHMRWKFSDKTDKLIGDLNWRWPFIDIIFYEEESDNIWNIDKTRFADEIYKKDWVFPLTKRPFEGYWFYAPKNTTIFLESNMDLSTCVTSSWNHRHEHGFSQRYTRKCDELRPYYAFVDRTRMTNRTVKEALTLGSQVFEEVIFF